MNEKGAQTWDGPIRVRARISVVRTEDGGRKGPFTCRYRPNHNFGSSQNNAFYIGQLEVPEGKWIYPGESFELVITFLNGPGLSDHLQVGRVWRIQEGAKLVATGEVLAVLPDNVGSAQSGRGN